MRRDAGKPKLLQREPQYNARNLYRVTNWTIPAGMTNLAPAGG